MEGFAELYRPIECDSRQRGIVMEQGNNMLYSFAPVFTSESRVMILGSMPSNLSLKKGQYYGNPRNAMWPILFSLLGEPLEEDYDKRIAMALRHGLSFWDVARSCQRKTSADSKIRDVTPNALETVLEQCPHLKAFAFNGKKAYEMFEKFYGDRTEYSLSRKMEILVLPSTSPANAMLNLEEKQRAWSAVVPFLTKK